MKKVLRYIRFLTNVDLIQFIYLNWFCKNVIRTGKGKIIPYPHSIIEFASSATIFVAEEDLEFGCEKLKNSKIETLIRLRENAIWSASGGCKIAYGSTIEVLQSGLFDHEYFTMNSNSTIICGKHITLGQDVMISRNVVIYDSDFHSLIIEGIKNEMAKEVVVGNHVWIGANSLILKGSEIHSDCVIAANALITGIVQTKDLIASENNLIVLRKGIKWER